MIPGARKLTIGSTDYYWKANGGKSRYIGVQDPSLRLIVLRENSGQCLTADLFSKSWKGSDDYPDWYHRIALTPKDVKKLILCGLKNGWDPSIKGAAFDLNKVTNDIELSKYKLI